MPPVEKQEDLIKILRQYKILPESEIPQFRLPELYFYDATKLSFDNESLDLIYSAVAIRFFVRKAEFLEEVCRALKPGGIAILHIGESGWNYPYSYALDHPILTLHRSRFVLKYKNELIPLQKYLQLLAGDTFRFRFINRPRCVLEIVKYKPGTLDLQLTFHTEYSDKLREFPYKEITGKDKGGYRSVYDLNAERYAELFEKGLLSREDLQTEVEKSELLVAKEPA
jgi:SAM-dependent methyltransferase